MGQQRRSGWFAVLGILVSLVCLAFAAGDALRDPKARQDMQRAFTQADYRTLPVIWLALAAFYVLKAWRWRLLLKPVGDFHSVRDLLPPTMAGFAWNNLLPAHLGDFIRVFLFAQQRGLNKTAVLSTVVLERVFDIVAILAFLGAGLVFVPGLDPSVRQTALVAAVMAAVLVAGALLYMFWTKPFVRIFEWILAKFVFIPAALRTKLTGMLESGAEGLAALRSPRLIVGILIGSFGQWALNGLMVHLALVAFGINVSPLVSCIVLGVVAFGVTVPSSPGYFGVIQLCFVSVLQLFVNDRAAIFSASVYYHLAQYIPVTLIGLACFYRTGLSLKDVQSSVSVTPATT